MGSGLQLWVTLGIIVEDGMYTSPQHTEARSLQLGHSLVSYCFLHLFGGNEYLCVEVRGQFHESDLNILWLPGVEFDAFTH